MSKPTGKERTYGALGEIGKWLLVILLLIPAPLSMSVLANFIRNALGLLLFIIFAGKLLYDLIIESLARRASERSAGHDLLALVGIVLVIALSFGFVLLFLAFYLFSYLNQIMQNL